MRALIVIPTYNERENIQPLIEAIFKTVATAADSHSVDVLVVDDGSPDGTGQLVAQLALSNPKIHVLHRARKMGLGTAYVAGFKWGLQKDYEAFIEMDADFSHDPKYLPTMLGALTTHDVAVGSRYVTGGGTVNWGLGRKIISRGGSLYSRFVLGASIRDFTGGFNGWRRKVLETVDLDTLRSDGYSFQIEIKYRAFLKGFQITEFPITFVDRKVGVSKMNKKIVFEALARVVGFRLRGRAQARSA